MTELAGEGIYDFGINTYSLSFLTGIFFKRRIDRIAQRVAVDEDTPKGLLNAVDKTPSLRRV